MPYLLYFNFIDLILNVFLIDKRQMPVYYTIKRFYKSFSPFNCRHRGKKNRGKKTPGIAWDRSPIYITNALYKGL